MLFKKNAKSSHAYAPVSNEPSLRESPFYADLWQLFWYALGLYTFLALVSYSPTDPSWTTWNSTGDFRNWMGRSGSILSDLLFQGFGITSFSLVLLMGRTARRLKQDEPAVLSRAWNTIAGFTFVLSASCLIQAAISPRFLPWSLLNSGGLTGQLTLRLGKYAAGQMGAALIAFSLLIASSILLFRWKAISQAILWIQAFREEGWRKIPELFTSVRAVLKAKLAAYRKSHPPISSPTAEGMPEKSTTIAAPALELLPVKQLEFSVKDLSSEPPVETSPEEDDDMLTLTSKYSPGEVPAAKPKAEKAKRRSTGPYQLPSLNALSGKAEAKNKTVDKSWYLDKANILVQKLKDFGVEGEVVHISPGPVITVYEFKPASGVKIKDIANLSDDLTLALSVLSVRIVAPIPGKPVVGIEIPSPHREMVFFKDLVNETPFFSDDIRIPIALGRLASGEPVTTDLAAMPHLLVAGSTGTGKSVFINTLIGSLLFRFSPQQLKLILVDPKMVELSLYEGIPHLLLPVVVDSKKAALALRWAVDEMERRYSLMHQAGVRHLNAYNEKITDVNYALQNGQPAEAIPYIVVVIDEYADLMAVVPKDVELSIARLAQKARAAGIHLVLATQRPSTDVVTGTIKANFPSRISFRVASSVDSKTILDRTGAERLLGHGDMLFHSAGFATLKRMQGAFLSDADVASVVEFLKSQGEPEYDEKILQATDDSNPDSPYAGSAEDGDDDGKLYDQAVRLVTEKGEASISLIQRHLRIGYNRAALLMDQLEQQGVVAQSTGNSKRRAVLVGQI